MEDKPVKHEIIRDKEGKFIKGHCPNPKGRPKGPTLKEWVRNKLLTMTDEERTDFLKSVPIDLQWRMAEGNPDTKSETEVKGNLTIQISESIAKKNGLDCG